MELEKPTSSVLPPDTHPFMPERPPVRLLAIADVKLAVVAGVEKQLDEFYVGLLKFARGEHEEGWVIYEAERWRLVFEVVETPPARDDYRPTMVQIPHFDEFVQALIDRHIEYEFQKGTTPGLEGVFLRDPAGLWISVAPIRAIA